MLAFVALLARRYGPAGAALQMLPKNYQTRARYSKDALITAVQAALSTDNTHMRCRFCGAAFQSKNALFRHLRASPTRECAAAAAAAEDQRAPAAIAERKQHVATYLVGYGAGRGADAEAALTSLCSASSVTRATAVAARGSVRSISVG